MGLVLRLLEPVLLLLEELVLWLFGMMDQTNGIVTVAGLKVFGASPLVVGGAGPMVVWNDGCLEPVPWGCQWGWL